VKAARKLYPNAPESALREAVADFLVHVRELRRNGHPAPSVPPSEPSPSCPICQGAMRDQRATKRGNQPDFKCQRRDCNGAVWLDRKRRAPTANT
jgi:hypothetical protein